MERGRMGCRAVVVVLLGLERRRTELCVVRELAWATWATRADAAWQHARPKLRWTDIHDAAVLGALSAYLTAQVPPTRWSECDKQFGRTLLHYACMGPNAGAAVALLRHGVDMHARDMYGWTPLHFAAQQAQPRLMEVLCAAGASISACSDDEDTPLTCALLSLLSRPRYVAMDCVRMLLANGARLSSLSAEHRRHLVQPWMVELETGLLRCRAVVVALLGLKRRRGPAMRALDRFVVRELGRCIWSTRCSVLWPRSK